MTDTLNLAQVNKTYNAAVWSVGGVRSLEAKIEAHVKSEKKVLMYTRHSYGNAPAVRALLESGVDVNKNTLTGYYRDRTMITTALHLAARKWARRD